MAHTANKTLLLLSILLVSCQSPQKTIPDSAFAEVKIFLNKDTSDCSSVEAITRTIPKMEKIEAQTLSELFKELSFPENTLLAFHIVDRKAYVDLADISSIVPNSSCSSADISSLNNEPFGACTGNSKTYVFAFSIVCPTSG